LFPNAIKRFSDLLEESKTSANSWGKSTEANEIEILKTNFTESAKKAFGEQWQINPILHYNEWDNFSKEDFSPVVESMRNLINSFGCNTCKSFFYVLPERGDRESLKCLCKSMNLLVKPASVVLEKA
jgi:hypothetical protein